mmetsp:Transcript_2014/g.7392  ORF Transcript_2014/g.7392 Transcript_2014/m.7392 type:complete len:212 (-) Transcript_2014:212-847(-)
MWERNGVSGATMPWQGGQVAPDPCSERREQAPEKGGARAPRAASAFGEADSASSQTDRTSSGPCPGAGAPGPADPDSGAGGTAQLLFVSGRCPAADVAGGAHGGGVERSARARLGRVRGRRWRRRRRREQQQRWGLRAAPLGHGEPRESPRRRPARLARGGGSSAGVPAAATARRHARGCSAARLSGPGEGGVVGSHLRAGCGGVLPTGDG